MVQCKTTPTAFSGGRFVQWSGTILAILVQGNERNISVKLFWNQATGLREDFFENIFFYFNSGGHLTVE